MKRLCFYRQKNTSETKIERSLAKNKKTKKKQEKLWVIEVEQGAYVLTQKYIYTNSNK